VLVLAPKEWLSVLFEESAARPLVPFTLAPAGVVDAYSAIKVLYQAGGLQPVLVPLLVAGIIAYLLDPVVRWLEKRGMKRLWAVTTVFVLMLITASLLALALMPAVQRMREMVSPKPANTLQTQVTQEVAPDAHLVPQLARFLHKAKKDHANNPVGWALTETDDAGEAIPAVTDVKVDEDKIDFFWKTRIGRTLVESKGTILETGRRWLSTGTSKLLGFLGLVLGLGWRQLISQALALALGRHS
jgi:hypothetical protein